MAEMKVIFYPTIRAIIGPTVLDAYRSNGGKEEPWVTIWRDGSHITLPIAELQRTLAVLMDKLAGAAHG